MKLVKFALADQTSVLVEVHEPDGSVRAGARGSREQARETLEEALHTVLPSIKSVMEKLHQAASKPDVIEISFGISLSASAGAFISAASAGANFSVTLRWTNASERLLPQ